MRSILTSTARPAARLRMSLSAGILLVMSVTGVWGDTPVPPQEHAERYEFDQTTGQWVKVAEPVPGTEDGDLAIARQWIAREEYKTAQKIIEDWIETYGEGAKRYPEALYLMGVSQLARNRYRDADETFQMILNDYPGSPYAGKALSGRFRIAEQYLAGKRRRAWGGLIRIKDEDGGIEMMDDIISNYSDTAMAESAQMAKGDYYYYDGQFDLAEDEYAAFAREFPRSQWHPRALLMSAQSALASFSGVKFDDAPLTEARERFTQFREQYPVAAQEEDVPIIIEQIDATRADKRYAIAAFYEKTGQPAGARYYYRTIVDRWPDTPAATQAAARLAALGEGPAHEVPATRPESKESR